jgi:hypothetical protein
MSGLPVQLDSNVGAVPIEDYPSCSRRSAARSVTGLAREAAWNRQLQSAGGKAGAEGKGDQESQKSAPEELHHPEDVP